MTMLITFLVMFESGLENVMDRLVLDEMYKMCLFGK